ncbi:NADH-ubiquinone oxidoreductase-F iron-sulfur binding region domain-containing protein [Actinoplanes sp. L3-i22]|uniref:NADH-ubiquinone oxidoreductase-F iron-sulfur binding region domain-containing protein n=1 Tax=Actinoplanes sp. L3-i22 TaxID=2836373 RepID=UPI001C78ED10|nr:NADH-ubiquinone oxidoreductase-F iron-sulfur binding region domain-containing protein [Actinoplanes sp. L3-i22]BCY11604.1 NADH dehydrogenase [Actinoplanes sp. L3-i22]
MNRLLAGDNGPMPDLGAERIVALARDAGLTGRGGAGFPVWRKLAAVAGAGRPAAVIANAAEGEPASGKDKALIAGRPDLVLDGLQLAARATGARSAHLYASNAVLDPLRALVRARRDPLPVSLHPAPEVFVAGEESAVVSAVGGRGAIPADKRIRITEAGTLVQNVETLAHLALIARRGAAWFREAGTGEEPGTFLATVSGAVNQPGVVEAGYGVPLGELLAAAGGTTARLRAVLVGGYHGGWVPADPRLPVSRAGLARYGASPGAGVVVALPERDCGLVATARIAGYLAGEVAGQCGPCVNGLPRLAGTLSDLALRRNRPGLPAEVERLARLVTGRGACRHPDGTARMVLSGLRAFDADVRAHLAGRCLAAEAMR